MTLLLFNTRTKKKEVFKAITNTVGMYTCGPTVYNYAHIGNYRTYIFEDLLRRFLKYKGFKIKQVMNVTDVDDKTIKGSREEKKSLSEYTKKYKDAFFEDLDTLHIERAELYPEATQHVQEMIQLIQVLLDKKHAYKGDDGSIYFSIKSFKKYGKLARVPIDQLQAGARVNNDEYEKEQAADFALWKAYSEEDGEVFWESPFGKGRPGWHIECSAMSMKHLSKVFDNKLKPESFETIDIHTGGIDNLFPHHEDEVAQSEGVTGKQFVNFWLHAEHLIVDGKKMSKSLGNFYTLKDLLKKGYQPLAIRYVLLATHYKQQLNFTIEGLESAQTIITRFRDFLIKLDEVTKEGKITVDGHIANARDAFTAALDDDLNISEALAAIFEFMRVINTAMPTMTTKDSEAVKEFMKELNTVLGIFSFEQEPLSKELQQLVDERETARKEKNWQRSDELRDLLKEKGILVEDTAHGQRWKRA